MPGSSRVPGLIMSSGYCLHVLPGSSLQVLWFPHTSQKYASWWVVYDNLLLGVSECVYSRLKPVVPGIGSGSTVTLIWINHLLKVSELHAKHFPQKLLHTSYLVIYSNQFVKDYQSISS